MSATDTDLAPAPRGRRVCDFGPFRLDPANRLLVRAGEPVPLTSKLLDLLCFFVESPGRLLTKDEILAGVWSGTFVEEGNLARHVSLLRKHLGEGPKDHTYIETVPGQGYRFIAHVTTVLAPDPPWPAGLRPVAPDANATAGVDLAPAPDVLALPGQAPPPTTGAHPPAGGSPRRVPAALGVAAVVLGAAGWFAWSRPAAVTGVAAPTLRVDVDLGSDVVLTLDADRQLGGGDRVVALTPAGDRLVFLSGGQLHVRALDATHAAPIAGTEGTVQFFVSADGREVAFASQGSLKKVPLDGGPVATIVDGLPLIRGGTWYGETIVLGTTSGGLLRVPSAGGRLEPLTTLEPGEITHRWPHFLPGGEAVLFTAHQFPGWFATASLAVVSLRDGRRTHVLDRAAFGRVAASPGAPHGVLVYLRAGRLFRLGLDLETFVPRGDPAEIVDALHHDPNFGSAQVDVSADGTMVYAPAAPRTFAWLEASGGRQPLRLEGGPYAGPAVAPDGSRFSLVSGGDLWVYDLRRDVRTAVASGVHGRAHWMPDSRVLVFSTAETIVSKPADAAGPPVALLPANRSVVRLVTSVRNDGRRLAYSEFRRGEGSGGWDLWTVPIRVSDGGLQADAPEPYLVTPRSERSLQFSPDGRWVAYVSSEDGGTLEVYVRAFPDDGRRWKVSEGGSSSPQWSLRHPELFFASSRRIMVAAYGTIRGEFQPGKARLWASEPIPTDADAAYSLAQARVLALVTDAAAEARGRHVVTLWTRALAARPERGAGPR